MTDTHPRPADARKADEWPAGRAAIYATQDDCLIAIEDGRPVPSAKLLQLPPWRAVMVARVAARASIRLDHGTVDQLVDEARRVGGSGTLTSWWQA